MTLNTVTLRVVRGAISNMLCWRPVFCVRARPGGVVPKAERARTLASRYLYYSTAL